MTHSHTSGEALPGREQGSVRPLAGTATNTVLESRAGLLINVESEEALTRELPALAASIAAHFRSLISVPMISGDRVVGGLHLRSRTLNAYAERHLAVAEQVGAQIAGAVANAQLQAATRRESEERAALAEIGRIISSSLVLDEIYERFGDAVKRLIPYDGIAIVTADMGRGVLSYRYFKAAETRARPGREEIPLAGTIAEAAIENGSAVCLRDEPGNPLESRFPGSFLLSDFPDVKAVISAPMVYRGRAIAVLNLASEDPDAYTENHISLAQSVADQIAGAVASAQLHAQLARESRELTALNRLFQQQIAGEAEATGRYRKLREGLERLAREAEDLLERVKERPPPGLDEAPGGDAGDSPSQL